MNELLQYIMCPECKNENIQHHKTYLRCKKCNSQYPIVDGIPILVKIKAQKQIMDDWNTKREFEKLHKNRVHFDKVGLATTPRVVNLLKKTSGNKTISLDVGCGSGLYTKHLKGTVISFDIVPYFVKEAARKYRTKNKFFLIADAENFPFKQSCFDLVFASQVIEHLKESASNKLIKSMIESSKDIVIIDTPNEKSWISKMGKKILYMGKSHQKGNYHLDHHRKIGKGDLEKYDFKTHGCVGFVTRRTLRFEMVWDLYDVFAWNIPDLGGNLIGIYRKN